MKGLSLSLLGSPDRIGSLQAHLSQERTAALNQSIFSQKTVGYTRHSLNHVNNKTNKEPKLVGSGAAIMQMPRTKSRH